MLFKKQLSRKSGETGNKMARQITAVEKHRQMSEELFNDRRGNLIHGLQYRSIFLYGCKKPRPHRDANHWPSYPWPPAITPALRVTYLSYAATDFILAQALLQSTRAHSKMMNENVKVTGEVKECSRKTQNCHAKNLHKKDTHVYNNCYELRSRAIKHCSEEESVQTPVSLH